MVARGAFGAVYRGMYKNNPVASKQHHALSAAGIEMYGLADDPEYFGIMIVVQEVEVEITALVSLHHPRLVELVGIAVGDYEETPTPEYIVTEWLEGGNLAEWIASSEPPSKEQLVRIINQISEGLVYLPGQGFIHRYADLLLVSSVAHCPLVA